MQADFHAEYKLVVDSLSQRTVRRSAKWNCRRLVAFIASSLASTASFPQVTFSPDALIQTANSSDGRVLSCVCSFDVRYYLCTCTRLNSGPHRKNSGGNQLVLDSTLVFVLGLVAKKWTNRVLLVNKYGKYGSPSCLPCTSRRVFCATYDVFVMR